MNIVDHALDGRVIRLKEATQDLFPALESSRGQMLKRRSSASSRPSAGPLESVAGGTALISSSEASQSSGFSEADASLVPSCVRWLSKYCLYL